MRQTHRWLLIVTLAGLAAGVAIAYRWPRAPLLAYWLFLATALGIALTLVPRFGGLVGGAREFQHITPTAPQWS